MHDAERRIAVGDRIDQHAHRAHVVELVERQPLALHLAPDAVDVFRAAGDVGLDLHLGELGAQGRDDFLDVALAIAALRRQPAGDALVVVRIEVAEAPVFELPLELPHAEAVRERRVDLSGLVGQPLPLGLGRILALAQLVQLSRELDQHQSRIGDDREQHLAQGFGLVGGQRRRSARGRCDVERAEAQQLRGDAGRGGSRQRFRLLRRQRVGFQQSEQHRARQDVLVVRQLRDDLHDRAGGRDGPLVGRMLDEACAHVSSLARAARGAAGNAFEG